MATGINDESAARTSMDVSLVSDKTAKSHDRLGICEVCDSQQSKYVCPRCEVKTCSLQCVNIHKFELNCSGVRDKTAFKSLNKFTNLDLLSDYRLLEDISKTTLKYKKDGNKRFTRFNTDLPVQLFKLKRAANLRGVRLLFLPQNFSKHRENSTYFEWKSKNLFWRIEWTFFTSSGIKRIVDNRVLDTEKLGKAISKYLEPENIDPDFEMYYSAGFNGVALLLKCEKTNDRYYELDSSRSIRANFRNKTIIEYPSIHVILKHRKDEYDLIDSDDEQLYWNRRRVCNKTDESDDVQVIETESVSSTPCVTIL